MSPCTQEEVGKHPSNLLEGGANDLYSCLEGRAFGTLPILPSLKASLPACGLCCVCSPGGELASETHCVGASVDSSVCGCGL